VQTITYLGVAQSAGSFLTSRATVSFSRRTFRPGVSQSVSQSANFLMPQSAQLPACCYELHKQISGGVGCTGGRGPVIGPAEGA